MGRFTTYLVAVGAVSLLASAAAGAPVKSWTGSGERSDVRLTLEGNQASGEVSTLITAADQQTTRLFLKICGKGANGRYKGTLGGSIWSYRRKYPLTGTWTATLGEDASLRFVCQSEVSAKIVRAVPLLPGAEGVFPLRIAWTRGSFLRKSENAFEYARAPAGNPVIMGDTFETGPKSAAILVFADRSVVMMQDRTRVVIPRVPENEKNVQKVKVISGKAWFAVRKAPQRGKFVVETEQVVASVRGTEFLVEIARNGEVAVTTAEGEVAVTDRERKRPVIPVKAGMVWRGGLVPANWANPKKADLKSLVQSWKPLLTQADVTWSYRRKGKRTFWQDRYYKPNK